MVDWFEALVLDERGPAPATAAMRARVDALFAEADAETMLRA